MSDTPVSVLGWSLGEDRAQTLLDILEEAGFVCVPIKPTEAMTEAAWDSAMAESAADVWRDMIQEFCGIKIEEDL